MRRMRDASGAGEPLTGVEARRDVGWEWWKWLSVWAWLSSSKEWGRTLWGLAAFES